MSQLPAESEPRSSFSLIPPVAKPVASDMARTTLVLAFRGRMVLKVPTPFETAFDGMVTLRGEPKT